MHDAVRRIVAGEADVACVAWGWEHAGGELRGKVRCGGFVGESELGSCVQVVAAALLGKVTLDFEWETGTAGALVLEKEAHRRGEAFTFSGRVRRASVTSAGACP